MFIHTETCDVYRENAMRSPKYVGFRALGTAVTEGKQSNGLFKPALGAE
jgi:hypothetical protein